MSPSHHVCVLHDHNLRTLPHPNFPTYTASHRYIIHKHINQCATAQNQISADQTIYLFVNNTSPKTGALMSEIYDSYKADDGFLYITYSAENTLGAAEQ